MNDLLARIRHLEIENQILQAKVEVIQEESDGWRSAYVALVSASIENIKARNSNTSTD